MDWRIASVADWIGFMLFGRFDKYCLLVAGRQELTVREISATREDST